MDPLTYEAFAMIDQLETDPSIENVDAFWSWVTSSQEHAETMEECIWAAFLARRMAESWGPHA